MCKVGNIYLSNAVDVCYIKLYHVKRSYQKMYLRDWSGWGGYGGGGESISDIRILYSISSSSFSHLHLTS